MHQTPGRTQSGTGQDSATHFERERGVTEVIILPGVTHARVRLGSAQVGVATARLDLLQRLAARNVPVFLIKLLPDGVSFALRAAQVQEGTALLQEAHLNHRLRSDLALVTVVAGAMRDLSGIMASIYEMLVTRGIMVHQTGDAHNAVHVLVPGDHAEEAADALRERFALPPVPRTGAADGAEGVGLGPL